MRNNSVDLASLRSIVNEAEKNSLMVCLSARTLNVLLDKAEESEMYSMLSKVKLVVQPAQH